MEPLREWSLFSTPSFYLKPLLEAIFIILPILPGIDFRNFITLIGFLVFAF